MATGGRSSASPVGGLGKQPQPRSRPSLAGRPDPTRGGRQLGPAGRVLVVGLVCFGVWALLAAPSLKRSAETSPLGTRRSASLAVLGPLARVGSFFGLDRIGRMTDRALGRTRTSFEERTLPPIPPLAESSVPSSPSSAGGSLRTVPRAGELRPSPEPVGQLAADLVPTLPTPSAKHPVRVLVAGDSVAGDLGYGLARILSGKRFLSVKVDFRVSTGLARDDYFDWPYQMALDIRSYRPTVVVVMFGSNDAQGFIVDGHGVLYGTAEWRTRYRRRVAFLMNEVTKSGRALLWVGMPPVSSSGLSNQLRGLNKIYRTEAGQHSGSVFVDSWRLFTDRRGRYAAYLRTPGGTLQLLRAPDGIHLTPAGSDRLAKTVFTSMKRLWTG
jgi:lysophospholipase L1-like esterase